MKLPRFLKNCFEGFEVRDFKEFLSEGRIDIYLEPLEAKPWVCHRCGSELGVQRGKHPVKLEAMPLMGFRFFVHFMRYKGHCTKCKKARSEKVEFISEETPHLTTDFAWWIGRICEIAAVSRVAELTNQDETTTWRLDLHRMQRMLESYKIPKVKKISVDEVYARKKPKSPYESRDERFFTVVSDLETHRVIWVSQSRNKNALDQFFMLIGVDACSEIEVVAADQHDDYAQSVREFCKNAMLVWDKFHIMQNFESAVNDQRATLHGELPSGSTMQRLTRGKYKYMFLKRADRRTEEERLHINEVLKYNEPFAKLEIIKERMLTFFDSPSEQQAKEVFEQVGEWIWQAGFESLMKWHKNLENGWQTLKNYFHHRVSSALSEGHNNVIKMLKRRAFGYRNMLYFRLKIMQVCGYLNSRYIATNNQLHALI
jgi:transposase